jgi:hypothetical protein
VRRRVVLIGAPTALALASAAMALVVVHTSDLGPRGLLPEPASGALVEGVEVGVEGGFVRSVDGRHVTIRLTRPAARVHLASRAEDPVALHLNLVNVWRRRGKLALRIRRGGRWKSRRVKGQLEIAVAPNEVVEVSVGGPPTEAAEFEFVVIEGGKEGLAELHAMLRGLGSAPPAFVVYRDRERHRGGLRELGAFVEITEASYVPVYVVAAEARTGGQQSTFGRLLGPHRVAFAHSGCRFIFLGATGERVSASDRAWLARQPLPMRGRSRAWASRRQPRRPHMGVGPVRGGCACARARVRVWCGGGRSGAPGGWLAERIGARSCGCVHRGGFGGWRLQGRRSPRAGRFSGRG